jgi:uncharacterized membrane protein YczE
LLIVAPHVHLVASTIVIPIGATVVMELVETLADEGPFDWRDRQVKTAWDLCVLALGTGSGVFTVPEVQKMLGSAYTVDVGIGSILFTFAVGVIVAAIRRRPKEKRSGWLGFLSLSLAGTTLALPWYILWTS